MAKSSGSDKSDDPKEGLKIKTIVRRKEDEPLHPTDK